MKDTYYQPLTAVWEVTMGCNMRCMHCGSSCAQPLPGELSTEEAMKLIDQLADLKMKWITLSGGEPLTRKDLPILIRSLKEKGIIVNIITNGWLLKDRAKELHQSGVSTVAVSIDGPREVHNMVRMKGSYERSEEGIRKLKKYGITVGAVTTITQKNIGLLRELREDLIRIGVDSWQVQIGLPMGNLKKHDDWVIKPEQVDDIIDFCYETMKQGKIRIYPADCIGYYNQKEVEVRKVSYKSENVLWDGCNAGIRGFGILHNGDILGCTSIRDREFIEGNIRERPLKDIWNDNSAFTWRRNLKKDQLSGYCQRCTYGNKCLGGCTNTRLTMEKDIYGENKFCSFNNFLRGLEQRLAIKINKEQLLDEAREANQKLNYQTMALTCDRIIQLDANCNEALRMKGFAEFMCGNYAESEKTNREILEKQPQDAYAMKGLALALYRQDKDTEKVLLLLNKANKLSDYSDEDLIHDIKIIQSDLINRSFYVTP